jgi:streptogramin lyase
MAITFVQSGDSGTADIASGATATVLSSATTPGNTVVLNIITNSNSNSFVEYPGLTTSSYPYYVCLGSDNNIWFTENGANQIGKITTAGVVTEYPIPTANSNPVGICAGPDGNLWFVENSGNKIGKFNIALGTVTNEYPIPTANSNTVVICSGPDGNLWFTEYDGNNIGKITTAGVITEYSLPTANSGPSGICLGPDGNLWFPENKTNIIGKITTAGVITEYTYPQIIPGSFDICLGPDGNLWFVETDANYIGKITPSGVVTQYPIPTANSSAVGICLGPDGNLWFAENGADQIGKITTAGVITEYSIPTANAVPNSLCLGSDNNIWFTESGVDQIGKISFSSSLSITSPIATFNKASAIDGSPYSSEMWYGFATAAGTTITLTGSSYNAWAGEFSNISYIGTATNTSYAGTSGIVFDFTTFDSAATTANFDQNNGTVSSITLNTNIQNALSIVGINATYSISPGTTGWNYYNAGGFKQSSGQDVAWSTATTATSATAIWNASSAYAWDMSGLVLNNWTAQTVANTGISNFNMSNAVNRGANW